MLKEQCSHLDSLYLSFCFHPPGHFQRFWPGQVRGHELIWDTSCCRGSRYSALDDHFHHYLLYTHPQMRSVTLIFIIFLCRFQTEQQTEPDSGSPVCGERDGRLWQLHLLLGQAGSYVQWVLNCYIVNVYYSTCVPTINYCKNINRVFPALRQGWIRTGWDEYNGGKFCGQNILWFSL